MGRYKKIAKYENIEKQLEQVFGKCDGLLETAVKHLIKLAETEIEKPHKAKLLTDEYVDQWEFYKRAEENGELLILPIAIGKPVYVLEKCCCGLHYDCRTNKKANAKRKAIEIVEVKKDRMHNCVKIFERPFRVEYLNRIGKTVFETLEEAKAAVEKKEV